MTRFEGETHRPFQIVVRHGDGRIGMEKLQQAGDGLVERVLIATGKSATEMYPSLEHVEAGFHRLCAIAYKAERGQVDLQFNGMMTARLDAMLAGLIEPEMSVVKASKSSSVRIHVPYLDFASCEAYQRDHIREGLRQAERLRRFYLENRLRERIQDA